MAEPKASDSGTTAGGMFAKDKEFGNRLDQLFRLGEPFILYGVRIRDERMTTKMGDQEVAELDVEKLNDRAQGSGLRLIANTIASAIVNKAKEATPEDFPCLVELRKVPSRFTNDALVIQWLKAWDGPNPNSDEIPF